jgi:hypothetical protein
MRGVVMADPAANGSARGEQLAGKWAQRSLRPTQAPQQRAAPDLRVPQRLLANAVRAVMLLLPLLPLLLLRDLPPRHDPAVHAVVPGLSLLPPCSGRGVAPVAKTVGKRTPPGNRRAAAGGQQACSRRLQQSWQCHTSTAPPGVATEAPAPLPFPHPHASLRGEGGQF